METIGVVNPKKKNAIWGCDSSGNDNWKGCNFMSYKT